MFLKNQLKATLYSMALGDAWGYPVEFMSVPEIQKTYNGLTMPPNGDLIVTDDTQMALALGDALMQADQTNYNIPDLEKAIVTSFVKWLDDPKNNRAPGMTCISVTERLAKGLNWQTATSRNSKGCGANMRVIPVVFLHNKGLSWTNIAAIAQLQSAITHAHPTALAASDITARVVYELLLGTKVEALLDKLHNYIVSQREVYHRNYLGDIWERVPFNTPTEYIRLGWEEIESVFQKVKNNLNSDRNTDPCELVGEGWIAEESFAAALLCLLWYPNEPIKAMQRAVLTKGDTDSIACLLGAFCGAAYGLDAFSKDWLDRLEYQEEMDALIDYFQ